LNQSIYVGSLLIIIAIVYFFGVLFFRDRFLFIRNLILSIIAGLTVGIFVSGPIITDNFQNYFKLLFSPVQGIDIPYLAGVLSSFVLILLSLFVFKRGSLSFKIYSLFLSCFLIMLIFILLNGPLDNKSMLLYFGLPTLVFSLLEKFVFDYICILESSIVFAILVMTALKSLNLISSLIFLFLTFVIGFLLALSINIIKITRKEASNE